MRLAPPLLPVVNEATGTKRNICLQMKGRRRKGTNL